MKRDAAALLAVGALAAIAGASPWTHRLGARAAQRPSKVDWPLHNLDLAGSRFSTMDQINTSNVKSLVPRWLFQHGVIDGVSNQTTPVIVDGVMYVTDSRGSVYAVNAADGHHLWTYDVTNLIGGGAREGYVFRNRGVAYADGVVYTAAGSFLFALDAKTGKPIQGFGKDGQASVILDVLKQRYPEVKTAISLGYWFTTAPQVYKGVLYIGSTRSESHIPGGHVLAVDAKTGKVLWHFNTVPQDERIRAGTSPGPTWVGGERNGGGIWETPSIDPELGLVYVAVGNPFGDSTKRAGINLFTDSIIALSLDTGRSQVVLPADASRCVGLRLGRAADPVRHAGSRTAGQGRGGGEQERVPVHPEPRDRAAGPSDQGNAGADRTPPARRAALADAADSAQGERPADESGVAGLSGGYPAGARLRRGSRCRMFTPPRSRTRSSRRERAAVRITARFPIVRRPGSLYVAAIDSPQNGGRPAKGYFSAFDPATGELVWQKIFEGYGQAGSVVTAGGVVFVGSGSNIAGYFFAYRRQDRRPAVEVQHRFRRYFRRPPCTW